ncbi:MAG: hypothetical protein HY271_19280 [Deltaproteobacteria bacterium]|nr:hypothetical protein [Deltaproteobacteria bacterium]
MAAGHFAGGDDLSRGRELEGVADEVLYDDLELASVGAEHDVAGRLPAQCRRRLALDGREVGLELVPQLVDACDGEHGRILAGGDAVQVQGGVDHPEKLEARSAGASEEGGLGVLLEVVGVEG